MALNYVKYERTDRKSLGTVAELLGPGGSYRPASMANWTSAKRVALVFINKAGESCLVLCSPQVSEKLRSKELRLSQLQSFEVCEFITDSGKIVNTIVMPSVATNMPSVEIGAQPVAAYQPTQRFSHEELIAF
jgi:hypothetical protein